MATTLFFHLEKICLLVIANNFFPALYSNCCLVFLHPYLSVNYLTVLISLGKPQKLIGNPEERKLRFPRGIGNAQSDFYSEKLLPIT
jgi:hypothetical protein